MGDDRFHYSSRMTKPDGLALDFMQHIQATPSRLWGEIATAAGLGRLLESKEVDFQAEEGRPFAIGWRLSGVASGGVEHRFTGRVVSVQRGRRLDLEWELPEVPATTLLTIDCNPSFYVYGVGHGPEVDLHIVHSGFPPTGRGRQEFDGHSRHWRQQIGKLAARLEGREGKPAPYTLVGLFFVGGSPEEGLLVRDVALGSPGDKAGIKPGDRLLAVNGRPLTCLDEFHDWIDPCPPGARGMIQLQDRTVEVFVEPSQAASGRFGIIEGRR